MKERALRIRQTQAGLDPGASRVQGDLLPLWGGLSGKMRKKAGRHTVRLLDTLNESPRFSVKYVCCPCQVISLFCALPYCLGSKPSCSEVAGVEKSFY